MHSGYTEICQITLTNVINSMANNTQGQIGILMISDFPFQQKKKERRFQTSNSNFWITYNQILYNRYPKILKTSDF